MKDFITKIVNSIFAAVFAFAIVTLTYYVTDNASKSLSASILDGLTPADITAVEFVVPKGVVYPVNGVVTINSVFVDTAAATDGNVAGSDLENSFITFSSSLPACTGAVFQNNQIILPDNFNSACNVQIDIPGFPGISNQDLTIEPISCAELQTSILRGQGSGFENIDPADLGTFATTTAPFDFGNLADPIDTMDLTYPTADNDVPSAKTFQIHLEFVPDISVDPINGINARATVVADNGNGVYEIKVRSEGVGNEVNTALNFAYVFNDLLGSDSPFIAYPSAADPDQIYLQATEMGDHPHDANGGDYNCTVDGTQIGPQCFSGGTNGQNEGEGVLATPLKLDNEILQGDSGIVFASNSAGELEWVSSHPSVLEVVSFSEAAQQDASTADFVDELLDDAVATETYNEAAGSYSVTDCDEQFDENNDFVSETCTIDVSIPVSYDITGIDYTVNVSIEDEVVPVTVQGNQLNGFLTGTGQYTTLGGVSVSLSGTVTGAVSGSVAGQYAGTVNGQIVANITGAGSRAGAGANTKVTPAWLAGFTLNASPTEGTLTDVPGTFNSTVKKQEDDISHIAILYGKRPGTTILSALDNQGCLASFEIEVVEKKVILDMIGRDPGDVLDVSDTVQINAYVGGANQEVEELENITAASGIEWFSSNEEVASIDQTGLLTALKPGVTNITARYDTGDAEIGTIESVPMQVTVNKISDLRVTFDEATQDKLPNEVVQAAHQSVIIAVHNPEAAGQSFVVEGQTVNITLPAGTYSNDISKVEAIVDQLETDIDALTNPTSTLDLVNVTTIDGFPGMLILQPNNQATDHDNDKIEDIDENGIIDIDTTALEADVAILPTFENAIPLPASETYGLKVIAQYDNGATKLLPPTQFGWVNTPVNYLQQASLDAGLIKLGEISGTSTVVAQFENADGSVVQSNYLTITVDSGPVIEFVRRIGSGSVTKGSRIRLQTKISDVDTISDIAAIDTSLVYSTFSTYQQINEDSDAIWFSATPFLSEVTVVDQGNTESGGEGEGEGEEGGEGESGETTTQPVALQYKTYDIPIEIPVDENLFDGIYNLIISISDASNHTLNYVYPIRIGQIGEGDVNGDGTTNMVDVIIAFQIASGILPNPTPSQLEAANVDGVGGVTLVDVILLFNSVTNN